MVVRGSGKRLCKVSPISRWNPGRNSLTIQLQLGIPRPTLSREKVRRFDGDRGTAALSRARERGRGEEGASEAGEGEPRFSKCYADFCLASHYWGVCRHDSHCYGYLGPISATTTTTTTIVITTASQPASQPASRPPPFNGRRPSTAPAMVHASLSSIFISAPPGISFLSFPSLPPSLPLALVRGVCIASMNIYPPFR